MSRKPSPTFDEPLKARSVNGEVAVTGPAHMHGAFTAAAAKKSAEDLHRVAEQAEAEAEAERARPDRPLK